MVPTKLMSAAGRLASTIQSASLRQGADTTSKTTGSFYDTLVTSFDYEDRMITWEGKCCQGMKYFGRDRGATIMGTRGSVIVDRDAYEIYDLKGNKTGEFRTGSTTSSSDLLGRDSMTDAHFVNFIAGIRKGEKLNAPVSVATSPLLCCSCPTSRGKSTGSCIWTRKTGGSRATRKR